MFSLPEEEKQKGKNETERKETGENFLNFLVVLQHGAKINSHRSVVVSPRRKRFSLSALSSTISNKFILKFRALKLFAP